MKLYAGNFQFNWIVVSVYRLFPFRERSLSFLKVDATIGNQVFSHGRCNIFPGLSYNKANNTFLNSLRENTLGARDFSCAVSGFGQVLKRDPREKLRHPCLRPSVEDVSACGQRSCSSHARKNLWYSGYRKNEVEAHVIIWCNCT